MDIFTKFFKCYYQDDMKLSSFESILEPLHKILPFETMYISIIDNKRSTNKQVTIHRYEAGNKKDILLKDKRTIKIGKNEKENLDVTIIKSVKKNHSTPWQDNKFIWKIDDKKNDYNQKKLFIGIYGDLALSEEHRKLAFCLLPSLFAKISHAYFDKTLPTLTKREEEVLYWVKEGKSTWDIGKLLSISEPTITFHLKNIYKKLEVANRPHAVAKAISYGLIEA